MRSPALSVEQVSLKDISATTFHEVEAAISKITPMSLQGATWEALLMRWLVADSLTGIKEVWSWRDWPGRRKAGLSSQDLGIDLVAMDFDGQLIGIQAKYRNIPKSPVTTPEVQKLIGAYQGLFERRMIATNAETVSSNITRGTNDVVSYFLRHHFINSSIDWNALCAGRDQIPMPRYELEPYQAKAVVDVCGELETSPRTQLIMACGTGKSFTMLRIAESLGSEKTLVLAPTLLLVGQLRAEWKQQASTAFVDLAVCSDKSLTRGRRDEADIDATEFGGQVTTDVGVISRFLSRPGRRVVFGTYASSPQIALAQQEAGVKAFDLTICDEAHRLASSELKDDARQNGYKVVLEESGIRSKKRLFATATPKIFGGSAGKSVDGVEIAIDSMDNEERFGKVAFNFSFRSAIEAKPRPRLVPYQVLVTVVTDEEVREAIGQRLWATDNVDFETVASAFAVERAFQNFPIKRMISYHSSLDRARHFAEMLNQKKVRSGEIQTAMVSGKDAVSDRQDILSMLRLGVNPTLVTNARCLTEGVDVPALDAVAFIDPRSSRVDIVQAVGRAMRISDGKHKGYVIVPLYLRPDQINGRDTIDGASFKPVLDVLRALKAHDPLIAEFFTNISLGAGARKEIRQEIAQVLLLDSGRNVTADLLDKVARSITLEAITVTAGGFWRTYAELKEFVDRNNGMPTLWKSPNGPGVSYGTWVQAQRMRYRSGLLSNERIAALELLKGWQWKTADNYAASRMNALKDYVAGGGEIPIPPRTVFAGYRLGYFYAAAIRKIILGIYGKNEFNEFLAIHKDLVPERLTSAKTYLSALEVFLLKMPLVSLEPSTVVEGVELGKWVHAVWATQAGRNSKSILTPDVVDALERIDGWAWNKLAAKTVAGVRFLEQFQQREGHTNVKPGHIEGEFNLGLWVKNQRYQHEIGYMSKKLEKALERIPNWEWVPEVSEVLRQRLVIERFFKEMAFSEEPALIKNRECRMLITKIRRLHRRLGHDDKRRVESIWGWTWSPNEEKSFMALLRWITIALASPNGVILDGLDIGTRTSNGVFEGGMSSLIPRDSARRTKMDQSNWTLLPMLQRWSEKARSVSGVPRGQVDAVGELIPLQKLGIRARR